MKIHVKDKESIREAKVLVIPVYENRMDELMQYFIKCGFRNLTAFEHLLAEHHFKGKKSEELYLASLRVPAERILLYGLGKKEAATLESVRGFAGAALKSVNRLHFKEVSFLIDPIFQGNFASDVAVAALSEALTLASFCFNKYKKEKDAEASKVSQATLLGNTVLSQSEIRKAVEKGRIVAESINQVRELGLEPSNYLTPEIFADRIKDAARELNLDIDVFGKDKIRKLAMGGVLGVSQGSVNEPRFVVIKYRPKEATKHVCLVGKGVTFDTGGISLKPANRMEKMKYDMLGAATVIEVVFAASRLKLPVNITVLAPMVENKPSGSAVNPGDVLVAMSGLTVEVINTDAEGRLILMDALHFAKSFQPDFCVDVATLTGAVTVALGDQAIGLMSKDQALADELLGSGEEVWDRCWQLPLWDEYSEAMKGSISDLKNSSDGGAGTITAGSFLSFFIEGISWAHLDIAGTAWKEKPNTYLSQGPSGAGVRLLLRWLERVAEKASLPA